MTEERNYNVPAPETETLQEILKAAETRAGICEYASILLDMGSEQFFCTEAKRLEGFTKDEILSLLAAMKFVFDDKMGKLRQSI